MILKRESTTEEEYTCTLGYHSHTQWLLEPQIILLCDKIEMNKPVYDMITGRGAEKRSSLDYRLFQLLLEYEREGIVVVKDYETQVTRHDRQIIDQLMAYWEAKIPEAYRSLALELTQTRKEHLERKLYSLDDIAEPMYRDISREIAAFQDRINELEQGNVPEYVREGVRHCLEHVLLTRKAAGELPIFEWYGYPKLREWLLSVPSFPPFAAHFMQEPLLSERNTEAIALNVYFELFVGSLEEVRDEKQLEVILRQRQQLKGARQEIQRMNHEVWQFVNSQDERPQPDVLEDFTETLRERVRRLQQHYESITLERKAAQRQPLSRIVTGIASTVTSLASIVVPVPGVVDKLSDRLGEWLAKTTVDRKYPQLAWCYTFQDYRRFYETSLLRRANSMIDVKAYGKDVEPELRELDLCRILGISRRTLYGWEDQHLLPPPRRSWQGWRIYSSRHVEAGRGLLQRQVS